MVQGQTTSTGPSRLYATQLDHEIPPRVLDSYRGMTGDEVALTVFDVFTACVQQHGAQPALAVKRPPKGVSPKNVDWDTLTWDQYHSRVMAFAKSLLACGLRPHSAVNILGFNAPEWFISYVGALAVGGVACGIYTTNQPASCHYVTRHSDAEFMVVDSVEQLKKYKGATKEDLPNLKHIIVYSCRVPDNLVLSNGDITVYTFDEFLTLGAHVRDEEVYARAKEVKPGHCASLIYTSGTTGPPKAVMLSHDNITWAASQARSRVPELTSNDTLVSYLPLSHVAAQLIDIIIPLSCGGRCYFAAPDALKGSLIHTLLDVRPTFFFGVPRVYEKIHERLMEVRKTMPKPLLVVSDLMKEQSKRHMLSKQYGCEVEHPWGLQYADKMLHKIRQRLGFNRVKVFMSGAAPMPNDIAHYFCSLGIPILEVYGMSESTGFGTSNTIEAFKFGSVGRPMSGEECRVDPSTGELQIRGRHVFMGYFKNDSDTREALSSDGWLRTGDVVTFDADHDPLVKKPSGFIHIVGRCKDIIITAGGENIPPALIEADIKAALPGIASCVVVGDRRKYLTVLITLETDADGKIAGKSKALCDEIGSSATTVEEAKADAAWKNYLNDGIKAANYKAASRAQHVQKWALLPRDFSEAGGELTPTQKVKRSVIVKRYADVIDSLYFAG